ncbi:MAG: GGDEF domain-containing phosphodiesterase [Acidimicrobiia bacterium]
MDEHKSRPGPHFVRSDSGRARQTAKFDTLLAEDVDAWAHSASGLHVGLVVAGVHNLDGAGTAPERAEELDRRLSRLIYPTDTRERLDAHTWAVSLRDVTGWEEVREAARRIRDALERPLGPPEAPFFPEVSVGASLSTSLRSRPGGLLPAVRDAMQRARLTADRIHMLDERTQLEEKRRQHALRALNSSLLDESEMEVWYQPIVSLSDPRVLAAEALVRWPSLTSRLIDVGRIVAIAEERGVIGALGNLVLDRTIALAKAWHDDLPAPPNIHVNVSPKQLHEAALDSLLSHAPSGHGLPDGSIVIEVTERVGFDPTANDALTTLKERGFGLSLDDFGTGYSNLAAAQRLPLDSIKLDGSVIRGRPQRGLQVDTYLGQLVAALHDLVPTCYAEGVETSHQLALVRAAGFDGAQGFLLGRPMPDDAITDFVTRDGHG